MGGETEVIIALFKGVIWLFTASYAEINPFIDRVLYFAFVIFVVRWLWKKTFGK